MALNHFYRVTATGQWCGAGHSKSQAGTDWIAVYEQALGLAAGSIEEVESETDPRTGTLLVEPAGPPPMPDPNSMLAAELSDLEGKLRGLGDALNIGDNALAKTRAYEAADRAKNMAFILNGGG